MTEENLKQRMKSGEILIGVSVPINASLNEMESIISKDEYAFVSTDSQHNAFNEETLVDFCQHASKLGIPVQFRIKHTRETYLIGNILDLGPLGIEVPQVEDIETARTQLQKLIRQINDASRRRFAATFAGVRARSTEPGELATSRHAGARRSVTGLIGATGGIRTPGGRTKLAQTVVAEVAGGAIRCRRT